MSSPRPARSRLPQGMPESAAVILVFCNHQPIISRGTIIGVKGTMPAYIIAQVRVYDMGSYKQYAARSPAVIESYGGRILARGPAVEVLEGNRAELRVVIIEFPSIEAARKFHHSPEYQEIRKIRAPVSEADVLIVDGL